MGTIRNNIVCPECGYHKAIENIDSNNKFKRVICSECGLRKEYKAKIKWVEIETDV